MISPLPPIDTCDDRPAELNIRLLGLPVVAQTHTQLDILRREVLPARQGPGTDFEVIGADAHHLGIGVLIAKGHLRERSDFRAGTG